jgi:hypothetical protein
MMTTAIIVHQMEGRMRLRIPEMRGDPAFFQTVEDNLSSIEDIYAVSSRPLTGSILIEHNGLTRETLAQWAQKQELFELKPEAELKHADASIAQLTHHRLDKLDEILKQETEGRFDLLSLILMMLGGLLVNEFLNGRLAAGSFALIWYALDVSGISTIRKKTGF